MTRMVTKTLFILFLSIFAIPSFAGVRVLLETSQGAITLELDERLAPKTVANFLSYVDTGFYSGTVFHRVIDGFMVQGGGMDAELQEKATRAPIANEANNGLKNQRGSIAMARTADPNSATSQFYINLVDNPSLDFRGQNPNDWGYAVFGKVVDGMATVERIAKLPTSASPNGYQDVPIELPIIKRASRVVEAAAKP